MKGRKQIMRLESSVVTILRSSACVYTKWREISSFIQSNLKILVLFLEIIFFFLAISIGL